MLQGTRPLIFKYAGLWLCLSSDYCGSGDTPKLAFKKWESSIPSRARTTEVVRTRRSDVVKMTLVLEIISKGGPGVSETIISCTNILQIANEMRPGLSLATNTIHRLLNALGWRFVRRFRWSEKPHRVWIKAGAAAHDNNTLRAALDRTRSPQ